MRQSNAQLCGFAMGALVTLSGLAVACGDDTSTSSVDAAVVDGGATAPDGRVVAPFATLNNCSETDYVERSAESESRVIQIAPTGLAFAPKCMTIVAGQSVRWEGSLTAHPLAPGNADSATVGSPGSPIKTTTTGTSVEFSFPTPGSYPYYCELHSFGPGDGMSGVVHVR
ncbi:MAG: hypothetical protein RLZZ450_6781, partial [Pseudomonadota bacterium]